MAGTFWIAFSIGEQGNREKRLQALLATVREMTESIWWAESTDFILFRSERDLDEIGRHVAEAIDVNDDFALLVADGEERALAIGAIEDALLFELMPYAVRYDPPAPAQPDAGSATAG